MPRGSVNGTSSDPGRGHPGDDSAMSKIDMYTPEGRRVLELINKTNFDEKFTDRYWRIEQIHLVTNNRLEERYNHSKNELRALGRKKETLDDVFVFSAETERTCKEICREGYKVGLKKRHVLGYTGSGVHVVRNFDILSRYITYQQFLSPAYIMVYKTYLGKAKPIVPRLHKDDNYVSAWSGFDCHISARKIEPNMAICEALNCSYVYIYEYDDVASNTVKYPRQLLPHAVLQLVRKYTIGTETPFLAVGRHGTNSNIEVQGETRRGFRFTYPKLDKKQKKLHSRKKETKESIKTSLQSQLLEMRTKGDSKSTDVSTSSRGIATDNGSCTNSKQNDSQLPTSRLVKGDTITIRFKGFNYCVPPASNVQQPMLQSCANEYTDTVMKTSNPQNNALAKHSNVHVLPLSMKPFVRLKRLGMKPNLHLKHKACSNSNTAICSKKKGVKESENKKDNLKNVSEGDSVNQDNSLNESVDKTQCKTNGIIVPLSVTGKEENIDSALQVNNDSIETMDRQKENKHSIVKNANISAQQPFNAIGNGNGLNDGLNILSERKMHVIDTIDLLSKVKQMQCSSKSGDPLITSTGLMHHCGNNKHSSCTDVSEERHHPDNKYTDFTHKVKQLYDHSGNMLTKDKVQMDLQRKPTTVNNVKCNVVEQAIEKNHSREQKLSEKADSVFTVSNSQDTLTTRTSSCKDTVNSLEEVRSQTQFPRDTKHTISSSPTSHHRSKSYKSTCKTGDKVDKPKPLSSKMQCSWNIADLEKLHIIKKRDCKNTTKTPLNKQDKYAERDISTVDRVCLPKTLNSNKKDSKRRLLNKKTLTNDKAMCPAELKASLESSNCHTPVSIPPQSSSSSEPSPSHAVNSKQNQKRSSSAISVIPTTNNVMATVIDISSDKKLCTNKDIAVETHSITDKCASNKPMQPTTIKDLFKEPLRKKLIEKIRNNERTKNDVPFPFQFGLGIHANATKTASPPAGVVAPAQLDCSPKVASANLSSSRMFLNPNQNTNPSLNHLSATHSTLDKGRQGNRTVVSGGHTNLSIGNPCAKPVYFVNDPRSPSKETTNTFICGEQDLSQKCTSKAQPTQTVEWNTSHAECQPIDYTLPIHFGGLYRTESQAGDKTITNTVHSPRSASYPIQCQSVPLPVIRAQNEMETYVSVRKVQSNPNIFPESVGCDSDTIGKGTIKQLPTREMVASCFQKRHHLSPRQIEKYQADLKQKFGDKSSYPKVSINSTSITNQTQAVPVSVATDGSSLKSSKEIGKVAESCSKDSPVVSKESPISKKRSSFAIDLKTAEKLQRVLRKHISEVTKNATLTKLHTPSIELKSVGVGRSYEPSDTNRIPLPTNKLTLEGQSHLPKNGCDKTNTTTKDTGDGNYNLMLLANQTVHNDNFNTENDITDTHAMPFVDSTVKVHDKRGILVENVNDDSQETVIGGIQLSPSRQDLLSENLQITLTEERKVKELSRQDLLSGNLQIALTEERKVTEPSRQDLLSENLQIVLNEEKKVMEPSKSVETSTMKLDGCDGMNREECFHNVNNILEEPLADGPSPFCDIKIEKHPLQGQPDSGGYDKDNVHSTDNSNEELVCLQSFQSSACSTVTDVETGFRQLYDDTGLDEIDKDDIMINEGIDTENGFIDTNHVLTQLPDIKTESDPNDDLIQKHSEDNQYISESANSEALSPESSHSTGIHEFSTQESPTLIEENDGRVIKDNLLTVKEEQPAEFSWAEVCQTIINKEINASESGEGIDDEPPDITQSHCSKVFGQIHRIRNGYKSDSNKQSPRTCRMAIIDTLQSMSKTLQVSNGKPDEDQMGHCSDTLVTPDITHYSELNEIEIGDVKAITESLTTTIQTKHTSSLFSDAFLSRGDSNVTQGENEHIEVTRPSQIKTEPVTEPTCIESTVHATDYSENSPRSTKVTCETSAGLGVITSIKEEPIYGINPDLNVQIHDKDTVQYGRSLSENLKTENHNFGKICEYSDNKLPVLLNENSELCTQSFPSQIASEYEQRPTKMPCKSTAEDVLKPSAPNGDESGISFEYNEKITTVSPSKSPDLNVQIHDKDTVQDGKSLSERGFHTDPIDSSYCEDIEEAHNGVEPKLKTENHTFGKICEFSSDNNLPVSLNENNELCTESFETFASESEQQPTNMPCKSTAEDVLKPSAPNVDEAGISFEYNEKITTVSPSKSPDLNVQIHDKDTVQDGKSLSERGFHTDPIDSSYCEDIEEAHNGVEPKLKTENHTFGKICEFSSDNNLPVSLNENNELCTESFETFASESEQQPTNMPCKSTAEDVLKPSAPNVDESEIPFEYNEKITTVSPSKSPDLNVQIHDKDTVQDGKSLSERGFHTDPIDSSYCEDIEEAHNGVEPTLKTENHTFGEICEFSDNNLPVLLNENNELCTESFETFASESEQQPTNMPCKSTAEDVLNPSAPNVDETGISLENNENITTIFPSKSALPFKGSTTKTLFALRGKPGMLNKGMKERKNIFDTKLGIQRMRAKLSKPLISYGSGAVGTVGKLADSNTYTDKAQETHIGYPNTSVSGGTQKDLDQGERPFEKTDITNHSESRDDIAMPIKTNYIRQDISERNTEHDHKETVEKFTEIHPENATDRSNAYKKQTSEKGSAVSSKPVHSRRSPKKLHEPQKSDIIPFDAVMRKKKEQYLNFKRGLTSKKFIDFDEFKEELRETPFKRLKNRTHFTERYPFNKLSFRKNLFNYPWKNSIHNRAPLLPTPEENADVLSNRKQHVISERGTILYEESRESDAIPSRIELNSDSLRAREDDRTENKLPVIQRMQNIASNTKQLEETDISNTDFDESAYSDTNGNSQHPLQNETSNQRYRSSVPNDLYRKHPRARSTSSFSTRPPFLHRKAPYFSPGSFKKFPFNYGKSGYFSWRKKYQVPFKTFRHGNENVYVTRRGAVQTEEEHMEWKMFKEREKIRIQIEQAVKEYRRTFENTGDDVVGDGKVSQYLQTLSERLEHIQSKRNLLTMPVRQKTKHSEVTEKKAEEIKPQEEPIESQRLGFVDIFKDKFEHSLKLSKQKQYEDTLVDALWTEPDEKSKQSNMIEKVLREHVFKHFETVTERLKVELSARLAGGTPIRDNKGDKQTMHDTQEYRTVAQVVEKQLETLKHMEYPEQTEPGSSQCHRSRYSAHELYKTRESNQGNDSSYPKYSQNRPITSTHSSSEQLNNKSIQHQYKHLGSRSRSKEHCWSRYDSGEHYNRVTRKSRSNSRSRSSSLSRSVSPNQSTREYRNDWHSGKIDHPMSTHRFSSKGYSGTRSRSPFKTQHRHSSGSKRYSRSRSRSPIKTHHRRSSGSRRYTNSRSRSPIKTKRRPSSGSKRYSRSRSRSPLKTHHTSSSGSRRYSRSSSRSPERTRDMFRASEHYGWKLSYKANETRDSNTHLTHSNYSRAPPPSGSSERFPQKKLKIGTLDNVQQFDKDYDTTKTSTVVRKSTTNHQSNGQADLNDKSKMILEKYLKTVVKSKWDDQCEGETSNNNESLPASLQGTNGCKEFGQSDDGTSAEVLDNEEQLHDKDESIRQDSKHDEHNLAYVGQDVLRNAKNPFRNADNVNESESPEDDYKSHNAYTYNDHYKSRDYTGGSDRNDTTLSRTRYDKSDMHNRSYNRGVRDKTDLCDSGRYDNSYGRDRYHYKTDGRERGRYNYTDGRGRGRYNREYRGGRGHYNTDGRGRYHKTDSRGRGWYNNTYSRGNGRYNNTDGRGRGRIMYKNNHYDKHRREYVPDIHKYHFKDTAYDDGDYDRHENISNRPTCTGKWKDRRATQSHSHKDDYQYSDDDNVHEDYDARNYSGGNALNLTSEAHEDTIPTKTLSSPGLKSIQKSYSHSPVGSDIEGKSPRPSQTISRR